jgi:hypothetical protein
MQLGLLLCHKPTWLLSDPAAAKPAEVCRVAVGVGSVDNALLDSAVLSKVVEASEFLCRSYSFICQVRTQANNVHQVPLHHPQV